MQGKRRAGIDREKEGTRQKGKRKEYNWEVREQRSRATDREEYDNKLRLRKKNKGVIQRKRTDLRRNEKDGPVGLRMLYFLYDHTNNGKRPAF